MKQTSDSLHVTSRDHVFIILLGVFVARSTPSLIPLAKIFL